MNLGLLSKLSLIILLVLFLFSCGMISNGSFEKRKHLKGWHFHQGKKFNSLASSGKSSKDKLKINQETLETDIAVKSLNADENKKPTILKSNKKEQTHGFHKSQSQFLDEEHLNITLPLNRLNLTEKIYNETKNEIEELPLMDLVYSKIHNPIVNNVIVERHSNEPKLDDNPRINHPILIVLKIIGLYYALGLALLIIILGSTILFTVDAFILGIPILIIGIFLSLVFFIYYLLRLFRRRDGKEILSLRETFFWVGIIYGVFASVFYPFLFREIF